MWHKIILWRELRRIKTYAWLFEKNKLNFDYLGTSNAEQSTQSCKAGNAWGCGSLRPRVQKTINHPARMKKKTSQEFYPYFSRHIYPTPPLGQDMTQGQFLSGV